MQEIPNSQSAIQVDVLLHVGSACTHFIAIDYRALWIINVYASLMSIARRVYPWIAFEMCTKNKDVCLLMFNFIDHYYTEVILGVVKKEIHFA